MTEQPPEGKRAAQGRATREQIIEVATRLFTENGYEGTSIEAVLSAAGVSRGALYHHFAGKEALFEAVIVAVSGQIGAELGEVARDCADPVDTLRTVALAWIDLAASPVVQRVMLVDAPSVFGWDRWREMDGGQALSGMQAMLQAASDAGRLPPQLVVPFSHMLLAALDEIILVIARSPDAEAAVAEGRMAVEELVDRLLRP